MGEKMKVQPVINADFDEQDLVELGSPDDGYEMLKGWICDDDTLIYTIDVPKYHPYTGEKLDEAE